MPVTVEYELTDEGKSLEPVIEAIGNWGKCIVKNLSSSKIVLYFQPIFIVSLHKKRIQHPN
ncbi:transcriptional regulator, HxlR family [Flavobacterium phragmitis]|uniref:Transcriptional regulator, HxlR family n=2 Tax=Flavobacterium phragmitis TaxID=739143 RepID=A0A1I1XQ32_9FLAO|nr:transcriptional regulator, HxlR family [Flavobacterium phragmitis]